MTDVNRDLKLHDSYLGRQLTAAFPLAVTNIALMTAFGVQEGMLYIDTECTCGECTKCAANIRMLDHAFDVAGYQTRLFLKNVAGKMSTQERLVNLREASNCWK